MTLGWSYGDVVALRYIPLGILRWVKPVRVVEDSEQCVALYLSAGTPIKKPVHRRTGEPIDRQLPYRERFSSDWVLGDGVWEHDSVLMVSRPQDAHSFWAFWRSSDRAFLRWYVNFQDALRRTTVGFDTADHVLDLVIAPDLTNWTWKDEEEFDEACAMGRFTEADQLAVRAEAERVVEIVRSRSWPLDGSWSKWEPDPRWSVPSLEKVAPGWDDV